MRVFLLVRDERIAPATITAREILENPATIRKNGHMLPPVSYIPDPGMLLYPLSPMANMVVCAFREIRRHTQKKGMNEI